MKRLIVVLLLFSFLFTASAYASSLTSEPKPPHLFMDIPFHLTQEQFAKAFFDKTGISLQRPKDQPVLLELPPNASFSYLGLECSTLLVLFPDDDYGLSNVYWEVSSSSFFCVFSDLFNTLVSSFGQNYQVIESSALVQNSPRFDFQLPFSNHSLNADELKAVVLGLPGVQAYCAIKFDNVNLIFQYPLDNSQENAVITIVHGSGNNSD